MKFIGVTGTNGKTTITYLLSTILKEAGYKDAFVVGPKQNQLASLSQSRSKNPNSKNSSPVSSAPNSLIAANISKSKNIKSSSNKLFHFKFRFLDRFRYSL